MNSYLSKKIKFISFYAIVGVCFCHGYNYYNRFLQSTTVIAEGANPGTMLQFFISNALVRFAVPIFFAISGYLFFYKFEWTWKSYLQKIRKRVNTLLVPYFIWIVLSGGLLYSVYYFVGLERYSIVHEKVGLLMTNGVFGWLLSPPAFQLWYMADLFKLVIVSPIIYWLVKKCKLVPIVIFGFCWIVEVSLFINYEGLFFFTLGSYIVVNKKKIFGTECLEQTNINYKKIKKKTYIGAVTWVVGCIVYTLCSAYLGNMDYIHFLLCLLYKINVITGMIAVWRLYDLNVGKWTDKKYVNQIVSCTIFVFLMHEPLLHLLTDILLEIWTFNGAHTLVYFVLPIVIMALCVVVGTLLRKMCPKIYGVLTGGRGME